MKVHLFFSAACVALSLAVEVVIAGPLLSPDGIKPPPFVDVPGQPRDTGSRDKATDAIPSAVLTKVQAAHEKWLNQGLTDLYPKLRYAGGYPTLMLVAPADEPPGKQLRRLRAIVQACAYLVSDDAFDHAIISITTFDHNNPQATNTRNTVVRRADFQTSVKKAGNAPTLGAALDVAQRGDVSTRQICADLGIN